MKSTRKKNIILLLAIKDFLGLRQDVYDAYLRPIAFKEGFAMYPILARPHARGSLRLRSNNPKVLWCTLESLPCTPTWPGYMPGAASGSAPTILRYCSVL
jgi:hypothetical protein